MNPWQLIGRAQTPGRGAELVLYQRDSEFSLKADNLELMNSRVYGSEEAMARLGCQNLAKRPRARVLIGGLGMGYSVRTALDILGEDARVVVAELVPAVVEWNRGVLADLAGRPLDDRRTELHGADVVQLITAARGDYDAIMLDVDNGAEAMVRKSNNWLYSLPGLTATYAALRRGGVLAYGLPVLNRHSSDVCAVPVSRWMKSRCGRVVEAAAREAHIMSSGLPRAVDGGQR